MVDSKNCSWLAVVLLGLTVWTSSDSGEAGAQNSGVPIAVVHVTVIDGTGAAARPDQTVLVSGNRVAAVAAFGTVTIPQAAQTIDGRGRYLIPGLWDAHVHTRYEGIDHLRLLVAHGVTSARNMSAPPAHLAQIQQWRQEIARGDRVGPRLLTAGPVLDGPRAGRPTNLVVSNADEARRAVQESKRGGADFIKVYDFLSRESLLAIAAEAKAQGLAFVGHVPLVVPAGDASDAGQRSLEHLSGVLWSASSKEDEIRTRAETFSPRSPAALRPVDIKTLVDTFSLDKLRRLAARLKTNQTAVVPTLSLERNRFEGRRLDSMLQATNRLQYVPPAYVELWRGQSHPLTEEEERLQFQQYLVVVRELRRAGLTILAGTDVGTPFQIPGISLHDELGLLVQAGLTPMEALQAATSNPARVLKLDDQGTIERGMRADLVLLDANPLTSIENIRKIRAVIANGRLFDRNELDAMLADIQKSARDWTGTPTR